MQLNKFHPNKKNRYGEQREIPPRKSRIFSQDNEWYFLSREYGVFGPYPSIYRANNELKLFLRRLGVIKLART